MDEYHCNLCHNYDGDDLGMIAHFEQNHPREWNKTAQDLLENYDQY